MSHIYLANEVDLILVVPCTANFLSKIANGIADDLALNVILASKKKSCCTSNEYNNVGKSNCPKNLNRLGNIGFKVLNPKSGKTCMWHKRDRKINGS